MSLVPAASLILVVIFGVGIFLLPVLYTELAVKYNVSALQCLDHDYNIYDISAVWSRGV